MGKVLFTGNRSEANEHLNEKLQEKIDCIFVELKEQRILETAEKEKVTLIVIHLTALSSEERVELARLLHDTDKIPFILTGSRDELHKYFGRTEARILRFIRTPLLFSAFVAEIKRILTRLEEREIAESELYEIESKVIVEKEQPKHILIVDDDPVVLRTMSNVLRGLFRVSVVKTGNAAVSFLANVNNKPIALMITQFEGQMQLECAAFVSLIILVVNVAMKYVVFLAKRKYGRVVNAQ